MKNINVIENLRFHGNRYTMTIFNRIIISTNSYKILSYFLCGLSDFAEIWCTWIFEHGQSYQHVTTYENNQYNLECLFPWKQLCDDALQYPMNPSHFTTVTVTT